MLSQLQNAQVVDANVRECMDATVQDRWHGHSRQLGDHKQSAGETKDEQDAGHGITPKWRPTDI